jgi:hypothetical protein
MKILNSFFKAIFSSGLLGLVMFLMAATILWGSLGQGSKPFEVTLERMEALNKFQNEIVYALNSMQTSEAYAVFVLGFRESEEDIQYEKTPEEINQYAESARIDLEQEMSSLKSDGHLGPQSLYKTDLTGQTQAFLATISAHREMFNQALSDLEAGKGEIGSITEQLEQDNQALNLQLVDLITSVEQDRLAAQEAFPRDINQNVAFAVVSLTFCMLLALVGYQAIAITVRPLRSLRNMVTAIGGDQYRPETQSNLLRKRGEAGDLARALDRLARGEQARTASLHQEIERLRQELYESRRKRLKIFHPTSQEQEETR